MEVKLSNRIRILSLICTIFVVYRHAYIVPALLNENDVPIYVLKTREVLSRITSLAVPVFFIISGFFFFRHDYYGINDYGSMIMKKVRSLLIPFLVWNMVGGIALYLEHSPQFGGDIESVLLNLFQSHWYGPLWYVRDLMIWMLLYPIYGWLVNFRYNLPFWLVVAIAFYYWIPVASNVMAIEGLLFFLIGGWLSKHESFVTYKIPRPILVCLVLLWIAWSYCSPLLMEISLYKFYVLLGIVVLWQIVQRISVKTKMLDESHYSFFLYVTHIYILKIFKVLVATKFYGNGVVALLVYLLGPLLAIFLLYHIGKFCKYHMGIIYQFAVGGR